ncbi:(2Fe-2S)-binding protein [Scopulibacillus cellulosilyticus]|uniref:(2Fe-2S)-binding protein n=1 Tax=Scopulibacillus cellulosilyticus TaxID=2665665 RepID=A0ABW2Q168_9BACL
MGILNHPVLGENRKEEITIFLNGKPLKARKGQTVAAALMANGIKKFGITRKLQQARGLFCANGRCCSCFMSVNGLDHVLACMTLAEEGMNIQLNEGDPDVRRDKNGN